MLRVILLCHFVVFYVEGHSAVSFWSVFMLSVIVLSVIRLYAIVQSVILSNVAQLSVIMLCHAAELNTTDF